MNKKFLTVLPEDVEDWSFEEGSVEEKIPNYIEVYFIKEKGEFKINPFKPFLSFYSSENLIKNTVGEYSLEIEDLQGSIIYRQNFSLNKDAEYESVVIPYFLNISKIIFKKNQIVLETIPEASAIAICNENGICEEGEENLCPLDCKNVNNPSYPLVKTDSLVKIPEQQGTPTIPLEKIQTPKTTFLQLFFFFIIIFFIIFGIYYLFKRKWGR